MQVSGQILAPSITFSPDGRHLAWIAKRSDRRCLFVDGKMVAQYDWIGLPPSGKLVYTSSNSLSFFAKKANQILLVIYVLPT